MGIKPTECLKAVGAGQVGGKAVKEKDEQDGQTSEGMSEKRLSNRSRNRSRPAGGQTSGLSRAVAQHQPAPAQGASSAISHKALARA